MGTSLDDLARGIAAGERPALARALSLAERDPAGAAELLGMLAPRRGHAHVIGITGPPGAGKSTLAGAMLRQFLQQGLRVAVLAVDPSSPVSGGALLGDRFRIGETAGEERAFIRSTASRGSLGGLSGAARRMVQLMDCAGFDLVMVETVGTGQSEIDVAALADSLLVIFPPGLGDELQAIKAGVLELADLLVVTKSDTEAAALACQALRAVAPLWRSAPPIHAVSALDGAGIGGLAAAVLARVGTSPARRQAHPPRVLADEFSRLRRELVALLPFDAAGVLALDLEDAAADATADGVRIRCRLLPGNDPYSLGVAVGLMIGMAAARGLECVPMHQDLAGGRVDLLLTTAA